MNLLKIAQVVGIVGALLAAGVGGKWMWDYRNAPTGTMTEEMAGQNPAAKETMLQNNAAMRLYGTAGRVMFALGLISLISATRLLKAPQFGGLVMIISAFTPTLLLRATLMFTIPLLVGGIAAVFGITAESLRPKTSIA